jgi:hypothetical protein
MIRSNIPELDVTDAQAQRLVQGSPLRGLAPEQPGMSAQNWQQLAALSTQLPDISWLGTVVHTFNYGYSCSYNENMPIIDGHLCLDIPAIHTGLDSPTDHEHFGHRCRFVENVLKYGGIDFVLRLFSLYPIKDFHQGVHYDHFQSHFDIRELFLHVKTPQMFVYNLPKLKYFLGTEHFDKHIRPRLERKRVHPEPPPHVQAAIRTSVENHIRQGVLPANCLLVQNLLAGHNKRPKIPPLTPQRISNSLLRVVVTQDTSDHATTEKAATLCREQLGAQLTKDDARIWDRMVCTLDAWSEIFQEGAGKASFGRFRACMSGSAPKATRDAQGGQREARMLIEATTQGDIAADEACAVAAACLAKRQFDEAGMKLVCAAYGLDETETEVPAADDGEGVQQQRALLALGVVLAHGTVGNVFVSASACVDKDAAAAAADTQKK